MKGRSHFFYQVCEEYLDHARAALKVESKPLDTAVVADIQQLCEYKPELASRDKRWAETIASREVVVRRGRRKRHASMYGSFCFTRFVF